MRYVLVVLRGGEHADNDQLHADAHERFISSLIRRNIVLLGGAFQRPVDDAYAAYVLHCSGVDEARDIAAHDPFVIHDVVRPDVVEWDLIGINPDAIEVSAIVRPGDV